VVIGAGIASVNEWANALDAEAKVVSLLRNPAPDEQDLNTPRCFFEAMGIDAVQELPFEERVAFLAEPPRLDRHRRQGDRREPLRPADRRDRLDRGGAGRPRAERLQPPRPRPG